MNGPSWLPDPSKWPSWDYGNTITMATAFVEQQLKPEVPKMTNKVPGIHRVMNASSFSKYKRLIQVTAFVRRFIESCKLQRKERCLGSLTVDELVQAEQQWLQSCQATKYHAEINQLTNSSCTTNKALVKQLRLFIDNNGIVRCRGRIHNAPLNDMTKFPILLPAKHDLTKLIVQDAHERTFHSGENATVTQIRQKFWIPKIRQVVKSTLRKCVTCKRVNGRPYAAPETPPLVKYRVEDNQPFTVTGVDFTGALYVKEKTGRNTKAYICLFTCAATRAIHLEVVLDLTEGSFLQAFRRFASRKSLPRLMVSDNAMTFQAASNHLRHLTSSKSLHHDLSAKRTQWQFIPKRAPWFGGWWERLIGLTKTTLKKILGRSYITYEELQTIVTEIEAVLNNRPLTYVTPSACEPEPLTPSQLLYGRNITSLPYDHTPVPDVTMETTRATLVKRVRRQQQLVDNFRDRWKNEYLTSLREHEQVKGRRSSNKTIAVGEVVQIYDDKPRVQWQLGIVEEVGKGNDGIIRSAKLRTIKRDYK